jgi:NADH-quinone oxidoreductase subunit L
VGKSAQLPLQIWLPDAMAGPTPVSALIHAATMVTAGVYLVARTNALFALAPPVQLAVAVIGALTLLLAGFSALTQRDIKRVLAYSTMSQIGYMFLALGVGAWSAAIFHFMTHAFFKALLFLAAGVLILRLHHEHDMFKMGGLRRELPLVFWTFLIGACSLAALPLVTAGFYSKDLILWAAWAAPGGSPWLWAAGLLGALLTALYTFRAVFLVFFGQPGDLVREAAPIPAASAAMRAPLVILAGLSIVGGFVQLPDTLSGRPLFSDFLHTTLPPLQTVRGNLNTQLALQLAAAAASLGGLYAAYLLWLHRRQVTERIVETPLGQALHRFWFMGWGFDWLDNAFIVQPFVWLAKIDKDDVVDLPYRGLARLAWLLNRLLSLTQVGRVRRYALGIAIGAAIVTGMVVLL